MKVDMVVTYRCRTRAARCWVRLMSLARYVVGQGRAYDWAVCGARRLMSVKVISVRPS
jgi:hypothetical protein